MPIESAPDCGSTGIAPCRRREMAGRGQLRHPVGAADRAAETLRRKPRPPPARSARRRSRDARSSRNARGVASGWFIRAMKAVIAPMMNVGRCSRNASSTTRGLEAIGEHLRGAGGEGRDQAALRSPLHETAARRRRCASRASSSKCAATDQCVGDEVAMRQHRALRRARRS